MKSLYFILGWVFFALGAVSIILPVLPTTPFMLLALWAFFKSSKRFHNWLYSRRFFGPALQKWQQYGVISLPVKVMSVSFISIIFVVILLYSAAGIMLKLVISSSILYAAWFILTKPSRLPETLDLVK